MFNINIDVTTNPPLPLPECTAGHSSILVIWGPFFLSFFFFLVVLSLFTASCFCIC